MTPHLLPRRSVSGRLAGAALWCTVAFLPACHDGPPSQPVLNKLAEADVLGSISADARYLSSVKYPNLVLHDLVEGTESPLTGAWEDRGFPYESRISPDGSQVAYTRYKLDGFPRLDLLAGEVDIADVFTLDPGEAFALEREGGFEAHWILGNWMAAIVWNHQHPILGELRVREALTLAIDRQEMGAVLGYPASVPLIDVPATPRQRARMDLPDPGASDPERARALLEEVGWTDQDGDGIRERNGSRLQFTLLTRTENLAVLLQDQFRRVGVDMDIITVPGRDAEMVEAGEFDAFLAPSINTSVPRLRQFLVDRGTSLDSPDLKRLLAAGDTTIDPAAMDSLYREMWTVIRRDLPATYLLPSLWVSVSREEVQGLASPQKAMASMHLHELWIEEGG